MLSFNSGKGGRGERYCVDCVGEYREIVINHDEDMGVDMNMNRGYRYGMLFVVQHFEREGKNIEQMKREERD